MNEFDNGIWFRTFDIKNVCTSYNKRKQLKICELNRRRAGEEGKSTSK
jgi:hypothetical protein